MSIHRSIPISDAGSRIRNQMKNGFKCLRQNAIATLFGFDQAAHIVHKVWISSSLGALRSHVYCPLVSLLQLSRRYQFASCCEVTFEKNSLWKLFRACNRIARQCNDRCLVRPLASREDFCFWVLSMIVLSIRGFCGSDSYGDCCFGCIEMVLSFISSFFLGFMSQNDLINIQHCRFDSFSAKSQVSSTSLAIWSNVVLSDLSMMC